jgi:hypothetical protein
MVRRLFLRRLAWESLRSGTIASLAMMPFGLLFRALNLRIGHYGARLVEVTFGELPIAGFRALVLAEHFVIGWLTTWPLLLMLVWIGRRIPAWVTGLIYGAAYYVVINSLLLPLAFGDSTPWQLGFSTVYPSLIVHLVFGLSIAWASGRFVAATQSGSVIRDASGKAPGA